MVIVLLCIVFAPFKSYISAHDLWLTKLLYLFFVFCSGKKIKIFPGKITSKVHILDKIRKTKIDLFMGIFITENDLISNHFM